MKKYNSLTVKELLDLEDGYYNLMSPVPYVIGDDGGDSVECQLKYVDETNDVYTIRITPSETVAQLTVGNKYHVKLRFSSGFIAEKTLECIKLDGSPVILFDADMFDNLYTDDPNTHPSGIGVEDGMLFGILSLTTPQDENKAKYGDSVVITITEPANVGEINGIIRIITDVAPSGVTKIITTMSDNLSCFVENVLQDGDVLSVIATDKDAGEGDGDEGEKFMVYLAGDGSVDTTKTGMSGVDVYNELIKHDDGNKKIKNCVIIFDDGTELTEGLVNTMQVHVDGQIKEQRVPLFPINGTKWWQIGEDGYGSIEYRSA